MGTSCAFCREKVRSERRWRVFLNFRLQVSDLGLAGQSRFAFCHFTGACRRRSRIGFSSQSINRTIRTIELSARLSWPPPLPRLP